MWNLFLMEFLKYRTLALTFAGGHFLVLLYLLSLNLNLLQKPQALLWKLSVFVVGLSFGLVQMLAHRRVNQWIYLLQRPLSHKRILLALLAAGCCLLLLAGLLPYLLLMLIMDNQAIWGVEWRHYQLLALAGSALFSGYFIAGFTVLHPQRLAFLTFVLFILLLINFTDTRIWFAHLLLPAWFLAALYASFEADLSRPPEKAFQLVLAELPVQYGLYCLVTAVLAFVMIFTTTPSSSPPPDSVYDILQRNSRQRMLAGLEGASHGDSGFIRRQIELGEAVDVAMPSASSYPVRHQSPTHDPNLVLTDGEGGERWIFRHTEMLFEGINRNTRERIGWLGPDGFNESGALPSRRFASVAWVTGDSWIVNDRSLFQVDWDERSVTMRFELEDSLPGERLADSLTMGDRLATLQSNRNLYVFRSSDLRDARAPLQTRMQLPLPERNASRSIQVMELIDGYLVSMLLGIPQLPVLQTDYVAYEGSELLLYRSRQNAGIELINRRTLAPAISDLDIYKDFMLAPGLRILVDLYSGFYFKQDPRRSLPLLYHDFPLWALLSAALVSALSAAVTWRLLRYARLPRGVKVCWTILNASAGVFGVLTLLARFYWNGLPREDAPAGESPALSLRACEGEGST